VRISPTAMHVPGSSTQPPACGDAFVSAVILSYNSVSTLPHVLSAVRNQTCGVSRIIIVDNGSTDGTQRYCEDACRDCALLLLPENRGIGAGHNLGWQTALAHPSCQFVWALEHDCIPDAHCLQELLAAYHAYAHHHPIGAVGPIQEANDNEPTGTTYVFGRTGLRKVTRLDKGSPATFRPHFTFNGTLFPRHVLRSVGPLNEALFIGHEDFEYARRLHRSGFAILRVSAAMIFHNPYKPHTRVNLLGRTFLLPGADITRSYYFNRNALYLEKLYGNRSLAVLRAMLRLPLTLAYILLCRDQKLRRAQACVLSIRDALRGNLGRRTYSFLPALGPGRHTRDENR